MTQAAITSIFAWCAGTEPSHSDRNSQLVAQCAGTKRSHSGRKDQLLRLVCQVLTAGLALPLALAAGAVTLAARQQHQLVSAASQVWGQVSFTQVLGEVSFTKVRADRAQSEKLEKPSLSPF